MADKMTKGQRLAHYYGLEDLDSYSLGVLEDIAKELKGDWWMDISNLLGGNDVQRLLNLQLLSRTQIQQNWIIIRQLNQLTKLLSGDERIKNIDIVEKSIEKFDENKRFFHEVLTEIPNDYIGTIQKLKSAKQIYDFTIEYKKAHNELPDEIIEISSKMAQSERLYGNMYDDCFKKINEYLS